MHLQMDAMRLTVLFLFRVSEVFEGMSVMCGERSGGRAFMLDSRAI
jgi:hypothetical protein